MAYAITLHSDLGSKLQFARMEGAERLGQLYAYRVRVVSQDTEIDLHALLGKPMSVELSADGGYTRYFHGIVSEAAQSGFHMVDRLRHASYELTLVPKPWLLTQKIDCRIYTDMSVPDIVKSVLGDIGYADVKVDLGASYPQREYCVQYREGGFNFISRLMEQEGIYYYFTHSDSTHTMVLADGLGAHAPVSTFREIPYVPQELSEKFHEASVYTWQQGHRVNTLKVQLTDYDPQKPKASLLATRSVGDGGEYHGVSGLEAFDYPGAHDTTDDGQRYAQVRAEAFNARRALHEGASNAYGLSCGALFTLKDFPLASQNQEYLVVGTTTRVETLTQRTGSGGVIYVAGPFECRFEAIASQQPYRSLSVAKKPGVVGLQTAVVTGSDTDEDIAIDDQGRVRVTFHWNKPDKPNAKNSCPVRVASMWAGKGWGAVSTPRVGQEVVVSFLEGDPDRPLIIGSVYNADNTAPYGLQATKTQSGIKSRSLNGGTDDFNELRFEDKQGSEEFFMHAQKDMREEVENDHVVEIDHDETITIKNDQTLTVQHDQTESVNNDRKHTVGNNDKLDVSQNGTTSIGQKFQLQAGTEIQLVSGASSITLKSTGEIEIKGVNITITGDVSVKMEGQAEVGIKAGATMDIGAGASLKVHSDAMLAVEGSAMTNVKGSMLSLAGSGMAQLSGGIVMIG